MTPGQRWGIGIVFAVGLACVSAQVPAAVPVPDEYVVPFRAEVARVEGLLATSPDKTTMTYAMARTWAWGEQWPEAMAWLRKAVDAKAGLDPSRDAVFKALRGTKEFESILEAAREATPPVLHSARAFEVAEGDLAPESVAYDARRKFFYFGSLRKAKVVRCSAAGVCSDFAMGLGTVQGLKARGDSLWVLSNSSGESALVRFDLATGRVVRRYAMAGEHLFNDLVVTRAGDVYLTDTRGGAVWHLAKGSAELSRLAGHFEFANGIAMSEDGSELFVATSLDGITVVDLKSGAVAAMARPAELCLANVDGLYFYRGALIAIQNGWMTPRVVRLGLSQDARRIERVEVLERRNPLFEGVTTGVVVGGEFFYMANIQDDRTADFKAIQVLKLKL